MDHDAICHFLYYSNKSNLKNNTFYFIHHLNPHSPHVFDKDCNVKAKKHNNKFDYYESYLCTLKKVDDLLQHLSIKDPDAKIIIQGDHGTSFQSLKNDFDINRMKIFNMFINIENIALKNQIDNVNAVRLLLSEATGSKINILEKQSYFGFYEGSPSYGSVLKVDEKLSDDK